MNPKYPTPSFKNDQFMTNLVSSVSLFPLYFHKLYWRKSLVSYNFNTASLDKKNLNFNIVQFVHLFLYEVSFCILRNLLWRLKNNNNNNKNTWENPKTFILKVLKFSFWYLRLLSFWFLKTWYEVRVFIFSPAETIYSQLQSLSALPFSY